MTWLYSKSPNRTWEEVSTVRGSGWIADQHAKLRLILNINRFTPLPRTVLTSSKCTIRLSRQSYVTSRILIVLLALIAFGYEVQAVGWHESHRYSRFDIYDNTRDAIETRIILDNLAKQLNTQATLRGYLIAYAGKVACRNEAKFRLLEAKRYLKEKHNIDSTQVTLVDGGYQTRLGCTDLDWISPKHTLRKRINLE